MTWKSGITLALAGLCLAGTAAAQVPGSSMQPGVPSNPSVPRPRNASSHDPEPSRAQPTPTRARPSACLSPPGPATIGQTPGVTPPCVPGTPGQPNTGATAPAPCVTVPGVGGTR